MNDQSNFLKAPFTYEGGGVRGFKFFQFFF